MINFQRIREEMDKSGKLTELYLTNCVQ